MISKTPVAILLLSFVTLSCSVFKPKTITLPAPKLNKTASMDEALKNRRSIRDFMSDDIPLQMLSNLLWAANGINRPETSQRTAPSSHNRQEIDLYVVTAKEAYCYDAVKRQLTPVATGDFREFVATANQKEIAKAPICIVLVADLRKLGNGDGSERDIRTAHIDAGIVCQNINLYCAAVGLATVPRTTMDIENLAKALHLDPLQLPIINNPVAFPKK